LILKFIAREDALVREPGIRPAIGQAARYVGRYFDAALRGHPAHDKPAEFDTDKIEPVDVSDLKRAARKGGIWPADAATAAECGVALPEVEFSEGVWSLKKRVEKPAFAASKSSKKDSD
jgi:hypothetical protein